MKLLAAPVAAALAPAGSGNVTVCVNVAVMPPPSGPRVHSGEEDPEVMVLSKSEPVEVLS